MNRSEDLRKARRKFVKNYVSGFNGYTKDAVKNLSQRLFLTPSTIWKDLKYDSKEEKSGRGPLPGI